jgi:hypothetical protein
MLPRFEDKERISSLRMRDYQRRKSWFAEDRLYARERWHPTGSTGDGSAYGVSEIEIVPGLTSMTVTRD